MLNVDTAAAAALPQDPRGLLAPDDAYLAEVRAALARHAETGNPADLERGFRAAHERIVTLPGLGGDVPPPLGDLHALVDSVPELDELLEVGALAAGEGVARAAAALWAALGLHSRPPRWAEAEHEAARTVLVCACAAPGATAPEWLPASLRRISAIRITRLLTDELARGEAVWLRALGDRYGSLRHRCAPRTALRTRGLADLLRADDDCRAAVARRLETWVAGGGVLAALPGELEAAVVHARTPSRLA